MTAKKKRGGRVTPKGTTNPSKKKSGARPDSTVSETRRHLARRDTVEKGRGARPTTHHRGNR